MNSLCSSTIEMIEVDSLVFLHNHCDKFRISFSPRGPRPPPLPPPSAHLDHLVEEEGEHRDRDSQEYRELKKVSQLYHDKCVQVSHHFELFAFILHHKHCLFSDNNQQSWNKHFYNDLTGFPFLVIILDFGFVPKRKFDVKYLHKIEAKESALICSGENWTSLVLCCRTFTCFKYSFRQFSKELPQCEQDRCPLINYKYKSDEWWPEEVTLHWARPD